MLDQSAINAVSGGRIKIIPEQWNFMLNRLDTFDVDRTVRPKIIHYLAANKPWLHRDAAFGWVYLYHRNQTPFPIDPPTAPYRSTLRWLVNMAPLRRKYSGLYVLTRHFDRVFTEPYLASIPGGGS